MKVVTFGKIGGGCIDGDSTILTKEHGNIVFQRLFEKMVGIFRHEVIVAVLPPGKLRVQSVNPENGEPFWKEVRCIWRIPVKGEVCKVELSNGNSLLTSSRHPFLVIKDSKHLYKKAYRLSKKDRLLSLPGRRSLEVVKISRTTVDTYFYDLTVDGYNNYASSGIVIHNTGCTSVSFNTAVWLSKLYNKRIAFIEADFGRNSSEFLWDPLFLKAREENPDDYPTLREYLNESAKPWEIAHVSNRYPEYRNIAFIPASQIFVSKKDLYKNYGSYEEKMRNLIEFLKSRCTMIIIDGPGGGGFSGMADYYLLLPVSDAFIPVVEPNKPTINATQPLIDLSTLLKLEYPTYIVYKVRRKDLKSIREITKPIRKSATQPYFIVPYDENMEKSYRIGIPIAIQYPDSKAGKEIRRIAEFLMDAKIEREVKRKVSLAPLINAILYGNAQIKALVYQIKEKLISKGKVDDEISEELEEIEKLLKAIENT